MSKYDDKTQFSELIRAATANQSTSLCASSQIWNTNERLGKTLGELATDKTWDAHWGIWLLQKFGTEIDISVRKRLITAVEDSMLAFRTYLDLPWLTDGEDKLLESIFEGKLPTAEEELKKGIVKRAKNVSNSL
mgnify:CR=1 FL=1